MDYSKIPSRSIERMADEWGLTGYEGFKFLYVIRGLEAHQAAKRDELEKRNQQLGR